MNHNKVLKVNDKKVLKVNNNKLLKEKTIKLNLKYGMYPARSIAKEKLIIDVACRKN